MEQVLTGFVRAYRAAGGAASTAETMDAARAVALLGYGERHVLKDSLGLALAKSAADKALLDEVFERYFALPNEAEEPSAQDQTQPGSAEAGPTGQAEVDAMLALAQGQPSEGAPSQSGRASPALQVALARAAQAVGLDDIRLSSQAGHYTARMLQAMGLAPLEQRLLQKLQEHKPQAQAEAALLQRTRDTLRRHARTWVQQRFELFGQPASEAFMREVLVQRPLGRLAPQDMERMKQTVTRMARRLAQRHARRRRVTLRGHLDMRRTLRESAAQGGVPFHLHFKTRRRDKPRLVVVCDVSTSVAAHVRFLLLFLFALQDAVADLRCFAFSNELVDVGEPLRTLAFDDAMAHILHRVGGGATDYGSAFEGLMLDHADAIDRRTTVLVLGDGRSNHANPRVDLLAEAALRAKRLVWLCPERENRWGTGDSCMLQYRPHCTHATHCETALDLERAIDQALAAYD